MTLDLQSASSQSTLTQSIPYFCITHKPIPWHIPEFMTVVTSDDTAGVGEVSLSNTYTEQLRQHTSIGEYAHLFALRRVLQLETRAHPGPADNALKMIGVSHYRRFAVNSSVGTESGYVQLIGPLAFESLPRESFLDQPGSLVVPAVLNFGEPVLAQYGRNHHVRDLLYFFGMAVDLGVITDDEATVFLSGTVMIAAPTVAVVPEQWLIEVLIGLESVVDAYQSIRQPDRHGYQRRAVGFSCERLHSLLLMNLISNWDRDLVSMHRLLLVSEDGTICDHDNELSIGP